MASEEERAKIMAEYMDSLKKSDEDDLEDDEALHYSDGEDDEDDGEFTEDSDDDDIVNEKSPKEIQSDYAVLQGSLSLSDVGRLVYAGTWNMKSNLDKQKQESSGAPVPQSIVIIKEKKKTKFKLKSKHSLPDNFLTHPLSDFNPRTLLLDGFFTTDETDKIQPYRKVKERDVEFSFAAETMSGKSAISNKSSDHAVYCIRGRGTNDFGSFSISGTYTPTTTHVNEEKNHTLTKAYDLTCTKRYTQSQLSSTRKRRRGQEYDDDDEISDDGGADFNEVIGLHEDANMSVEELKKKYYGNNSNGEGIDEKKANRFGAANASGDPDEDDGCGF